jgi:K+-transporting ATPase ATPase C chain
VTSHFRPAIAVFVLLSVLTGVVYPLAVTGVAQLLFPVQANGSIITSNGKAIGSSLIGQDFSGDSRYFWGRLSATSPVAYTAFNARTLTGSSGSNLAPTNPSVLENARARLESLRAADAAAGVPRPNGQPVPVDLVTASASGLDPHISLAAAEYQVPRVARARGIPEERIRELVGRATTGRLAGVIGEPVVNVLTLNLSLDGAGQ